MNETRYKITYINRTTGKAGELSVRFSNRKHAESHAKGLNKAGKGIDYQVEQEQA